MPRPPPFTGHQLPTPPRRAYVFDSTRQSRFDIRRSPVTAAACLLRRRSTIVTPKFFARDDAAQPDIAIGSFDFFAFPLRFSFHSFIVFSSLLTLPFPFLPWPYICRHHRFS